MKHEKLELGIDDLLLDRENPRTGTVASQSDALAAVIKLSGRNFRNMMRSIKDHGLDPGDAFYLVQEDLDEGTFTVVDGNRRLAALKVLQNPLLLKGTGLSDSITKPLSTAATGFSFGSDFTVDCVLFDSREKARDWIERRHGRGMEGEGRIGWGPLDIQRFQNDRTVIDVIEFVEKNSTFSDEEWSRIKSAVEKNSSTLKRFLESKSGRQNLGFSVPAKSDGPTFTQNENFVIESLSQIFSDIASSTINSREYNKASEIEDYFENLSTTTPKSVTPGTPKPFSSTRISDGKVRPRQKAKAKAATPTTKTKKIAPPRVTLAPVKLQFEAPEAEKGKQLFREAAKLRLKDASLASAFTFRAIIEHTVDTYMRRHRIPSQEGTTELHLATRIERVVQHINANGGAPKGDLNAIKGTLTAKSGPMSVGALNGYVHSKFQMPTPDDLRVAWEAAIPLFVAVYGPAK